MNCRIFTSEIADWLAGQLQPALARRMAEHRRKCESCARIAEREERLRGAWQISPQSAAPSAELWPRLAERVRAETAPARNRARHPAPWAFGAGFLTAMAAAAGLWLHIQATPAAPATPSGQIAITAPQSQSRGSSPLGAAAWLATADIAQVNPAIDDPAGTSMEHIWTQINSTDSAQAGGQ